MNVTIFSLIQKEIRTGLISLMIFFITIFAGYEYYSFWSRIQEFKALIIGQVDSLASNKVLAQDYLAIQPEVTRFTESLKGALPYEVGISVRLAGKLVAEGVESRGLWAGLLPSTKVQSHTVLPSGQIIEVTAEIFHEQAVLRDLGMLILIILTCVWAYFYLNRRLEKSVDKISTPLRDTIDWVKEISSNLPLSLSAHNQVDCKDIDELKSLDAAVKRLVVEIDSLEGKLRAAGRDLAKVELAEQVGHDIRSPLTTIDAIIRTTQDLAPSQKGNIEKLIFRILDVLNELDPSKVKRKVVDVSDVSEIAHRQEFVYPIVYDLVSEKRTLYGDRVGLSINVSSGLDGIATVASINRNEFARALSNLIDNAVEAIAGPGVVSVELTQKDQDIFIKVRDTGSGIPKEQLSVIGTRRMTFKTKGSGLGVYQAKQAMAAIGGRLELESAIGHGTTVSLVFPANAQHRNIVSNVSLERGQSLIVIDDDPIIRDAWAQKATTLDTDVRIFDSPEDLLASDVFHSLETARFVVDLEFKNSKTDGIELIRQLEIESRAILVTGKWDAADVRLRCECFGIGRFPKELLRYFEVTVNPKPDNASFLEAGVV